MKHESGSGYTILPLDENEIFNIDDGRYGCPAIKCTTLHKGGRPDNTLPVCSFGWLVSKISNS